MKDSHQASSRAASSGTQPLATQKEEMPTSQSIFPDLPEPSSNTFAAELRNVFMQGTMPFSYSRVQPVLTRLLHTFRHPEMEGIAQLLNFPKCPANTELHAKAGGPLPSCVL